MWPPIRRVCGWSRTHTRRVGAGVVLLAIPGMFILPYMSEYSAAASLHLRGLSAWMGGGWCEPYDPPREKFTFNNTLSLKWDGEEDFWALFPCAREEYHVVLPRNTTAAAATCGPVIATAYFDIGRSHWLTLRRSNAEYFHHMVTVMSLHNPMVIFTQPQFVNRVVEMREAAGRMDRTVVVGMELHCMPVAHMYEPTKNIMCKKEYTRGAKDVLTPERIQPWYNLLMWAKAYFYQAASVLPHVRGDYYIWLDAGCHPPMCNAKMKNTCLVPAHHARRDRVRIAQVALMPPDVAGKDPVKFMKDKHVNFAGTIFGTGADNTQRLFNLFADTLHWMNVQGAVDQDQSTFAYMFIRHPDDFDTYFVNGEWLDVVEKF